MPFGELEAHTIRTLVLELNVARVEGRLDGTTPEDRYRSFVSVLHDEPSALAIWKEYPVLARFVADRLGFWIATCMELLEALIADLPDLVGRGLLKQAPPYGGQRRHRSRPALCPSALRQFRMTYSYPPSTGCRRLACGLTVSFRA